MEAARHRWPTLGVLLIRDGIVSEDVLESILAEQQDSREHSITGRRLGEILVQRNIATPTQVAKLLAEQYELPYTDLDVADLDPRLAARLGEDAARRFSALPVGVRPNGSILLAIADPATVVFSDELRRLLDANLHFTVVGPEALEAAIAFVHDRIPDPVSALAASDEPTATTGPLFPGSQRAVAHLWPPLGALLVREGLLSDADLETALAQQRLSTSQRLGEILVDRGVVPAAIISRLVAEQYELEFVELHDLEIDPLIGRLLPEELASEYSAVPIAQHDDGSLDVAIADPTNAVYADELHRALGARLTFVVASAEDIAGALERVHERAEPFEAPETDTAVETLATLPADEVDVDLNMTPMPATVSSFELPDRDVGAILDEGPDLMTHAELALVPYNEAPASASEVEVPDVDLRNALSSETPEPEAAVSFDDSAHAAPYAAPVDVLSEVDDPTTQELVLAGALLSRPAPPDELEATEVELEDGEPAQADFGEPPEAAATAPSDADVGLDALLLAQVGVPAEAVDVAAVEQEMDESGAEPAQRAASEIEVTLERLLALGASALHFSPLDDGYRARVRLDGIIREAGYVASTELAVLLERLGATTPFRTQVTQTTRGEKLTLFRREHAPALTTLSELGFSDRDAAAVHDRLMSEAGVLVVCGPAGSGTTTTQYAALAELDTGDRIAATVEGSVHRVLDGVDQLEVDGGSGMTFAQGICALLESDTDIVLVGEIADDETAGLAFEAALSGRHVLAVLRAPSATAAIARLAELGVAPGLLSQTLACVVAQRLVRRVCDDCRETYYASESELEALGSTEATGPRLLARGRGCHACEHTGYRGRVAVFEVLAMTDEIRHLVGSESPEKKLRRVASAAGLRNLRDEATRLCLEGVTTTAEVDRVLGTA